MSQNKTHPTDQSVKSFLDSLDDQQKIADSYSLIELMQEVTGCEPKMWGPSIIGFDQYHYKYESGREGDWLKTGFSPRKRKLSIYLMCSFEKNDELMRKLGKHRTGKELIQESLKYVDEKYG